MLLSDRDIGRELILPEGLRIEGLAEGAIGPCSIDLMLSPYFHRMNDDVVMASEGADYGLWDIDPKDDNSEDGFEVTVEEGGYFVLEPGEFCLASTQECFTFPTDLAGQLEGKSSLARLGLVVHVTAGFFDAGFVGHPTLELCNLRKRSIRLHPGMPVAQMAIFRLSSPARNAYDSGHGGKYAGQGKRPVPSQYHRNFEDG